MSEPTIEAVLRAFGIRIGADEVEGRWGGDISEPVVDWDALRTFAAREQEALEREAREERETWGE